MLDEDRRTAVAAFAALRIEAPEPLEVEGAAIAELHKARLVIVLLGWMGLLAVGELFMGGWLADYAGRSAIGLSRSSEATLLEHMALGLVWVRLVSGIVTGVTFIQWVRLVVRNARRFGLHRGPGMPFTAERATWVWVIPLLNWFRPYAVLRAMRDVSRPEVLPSYEVAEHATLGSYRVAAIVRERVDGTQARVPIALWWGLFVAARLSERFMHHSGVYSRDIGSLQRLAVVSVVDGLLWAGAALAAIYVVRGVLDRRTELYRRAFHWARVMRGEETSPR